MKKTTLFFLIAIPLSLVAFTMLWLGYKGIRVNLGGTLKSFTIEEVEDKGIGEARYVEVKRGFAWGNFVQITDDYGRIQKVIYPIVSTETMNQIFTGQKIKVHILVEDSNIDPDCVKTKSCVQTDTITVCGITEHEVDIETQNVIRKLNDDLFELDEKVLIIRDQTKPIALHWNILMLVCSVCFLIYVAISVVSALRSNPKLGEIETA